MRAFLASLALVTLAGCKPDIARPVPQEGPPPRPTISSGTAAQPPADAAADGEQMSAAKARKTVHETVVRDQGVLKILGVEAEDFSEEEMEALQEALGTLEKKPPPPLEKP